MNINNMVEIAETFANKADHCTLRVSRNFMGYKFTVSEPVGEPYATHAFHEFVGVERLRKICAHPEINLDPEKLVLVKEVVSMIFVGWMSLEGIYPDTDEKISTLFDGMALENFHMDLAVSAGKGFRGLKERALLSSYHSHQCKIDGTATLNTIRDIEFLTSRLADREPRVGEIVPLSDGIFRIDQIFAGQGTFAFVLIDKGLKLPAKIVCRGTSARPQAIEGYASCLNNVQLEIGTLGVQKIWPEMRKYLCQKKIQVVSVYGKSLGGAHAQQLAILIEGIAKVHVESLSTNCSVGVSPSINLLFNEAILKNRKYPFEIHVVRNGGNDKLHAIDYVPLVGGDHLGANASPDKCKTKVIYICPGNTVEPMQEEPSLVQKIIKFIISFRLAHPRQSTLRTFVYRIILNQSKIQWHLKVGSNLEPIRKIIATIFHGLTFNNYNQQTFQEFYEQQSLQK